MGFRHIGLCVLTVWASIGDWRLLEHGHENPRRVLETGVYLRPGV